MAKEKRMMGLDPKLLESLKKAPEASPPAPEPATESAPEAKSDAKPEAKATEPEKAKISAAQKAALLASLGLGDASALKKKSKPAPKPKPAAKPAAVPESVPDEAASPAPSPAPISLDLDTDPLSISSVGSTEELPELSPSALVLDKFALRKGNELYEDEDHVFKKLENLGKDRDEVETAIADFYASAFEPDPELVEKCENTSRHAFLKQMFETPEYHELHTTTTLNTMASEIATASFAKEWVKLSKKEEEIKKRKEREKAEKKEKEPDDDGDEKMPGKEGTDGEGAGEEPDPESEMARMTAISSALMEAEEEIEVMQEAAAAAGMGPGAPGSNDPRVIAAIHKRIRSNPTLRKICEAAGKLRRVAQSKQRQKVIHGQDEMTGVELDNDLVRMLPHELAKLADDSELADDAMRRFVERQLMCRELKAVEPVAKGPFIVVVDESGSMHGEKNETSKALALTMAYIARHQKRWCAVVAYSGGTGHRLLVLPPGRWDEMAVFDWLEEFIGGGSSRDVPVCEMPAYYKAMNTPHGKTDLIFITDAICSLTAKQKADFMKWKESVQAKLTTLIIQSTPGDLAEISDEVHMIPAIRTDVEAVEKILGI